MLRRVRLVVASLVVLLAVGNGALFTAVGPASAAGNVTIRAMNVSAVPPKPIAGVRVGARPVSGGSTTGGPTGSDGTIQITLAPGQYFFGPNSAEPWVRRSGAPPVTVGGDPVEVTLELVPLTATGVVKDDKGAVVPGANVSLLGPDRFPLGFATTGSDGTFRVGGASKSDTYYVSASPPESNTTLAPSEQTPVSITVGSEGLVASPPDVGTIVLPTARKFARITIQAPNITIGSVSVGAFRIGQTSSVGINKFIPSPAAGTRFKVPLRPGAWNVNLFPGGDNTSATWIAPPPKVVTFTQPDDVDETQDVTFVLGGAQISGRVVDDSHNVVQGATAQLTNKDHSVNIPGSPGPNGAFSIGGITDPGTYYLQIQPSFFNNPLGLLPAEPRQVDVTSDGSGGLLFVVKGVNTTPTASVNLGDVALHAAAKKITGTITRSDGKDLGATMVNAFPAQGGDPGSAFFNAQATISGSSGTFTLSVPPGTWQVNVSPDFQNNGGADWIYAGQPVTVSFANDSSAETKSVSFAVTSADYTITAKVQLPGGGKPPDNTIFVNVHNRSGFGRGQPVVDGVFSMRVPAGTYEIDLSSANGQYGPPTGGLAPFTVPDPAHPDAKTVSLGTNGVITLGQRSGTITGKIVDQSGNGVKNVNVNAWSPTTNDRSFGQSDSDGSFTLRVGDGAYDVDAFPGPDAPYARQGAPQRVTVTNGKADKSPTFTMVSASATVVVQAVDAKGNLLTDASGFASAMRAPSTGSSITAQDDPGKSGDQGPKAGEMIGNGQPLVGGVATLRLPPLDNVVIGLGFPPGSKYLFAQSSVISTKTSSSQTVSIALSSADATITGTLTSGGTAVTGVRAQVFAMVKGGGAQADVDPNTGKFTLKVQSGRTWFLGLALPPDSTYGWFPSPGSPPQVDLTSSTSGTYDFALTSADGTVTGTVKDPSGNALGGAFVAVLVPSETSGKPPRFVAGAETNAQGVYSVKVQKNQTYQVDAHVAPEKGFEKGYISPPPQNCTSASWTNGTCTLSFQFKAADATIAGTVTDSSGNAAQAFVRAWSDNGGNAFAQTGSDGAFSISTTAGDKWHLQAVQETTASDGTKSFAVSPVKNLTPTAGTNSGISLALGAAKTMPSAVTSSFDATSLQVITLSNGVKVTIPAGALATSGQVTVRATPKPQLPADKSAQPLDIGYTLEATDANGSVITKFNATVTIEIPYDVSQLAADTTEDDLVPSYYDTTTGTWKKADNVTIDKTNHVAIVLVDHFTDFAVLATTTTRSTQTSFALFVPLSPRSVAP
jgi:hypothetical protein